MRTLDPKIFMDEFIGSQSMRLRLLWLGLIISLADDQGRMADNPTTIRALIFPYDVRITMKDIEVDLRILNKAHKIIRYRAGTNGDGKQLIQIVQWWRYQNKAQWASRSAHPAPAKWIDRIRCHEQGHGQDVVTSNWDQPGGFMKRLPRRLPSPLPSGQGSGQPSREDEDDDKGRGLGRGKDQEPTHPPTPSRGNERAGGRAGIDSKADEQLKQLEPKDRKEAERLMPILRSVISSETKIITLSVLVAMRHFTGDKIDYLLAAIASAYDDDRAKNKAAITAHRIEHDQVAKQYLNPDTWIKIPKEILAAAGIKDLNSYLTELKVERFMHGNNLQKKIARLRSKG